MGSDFHWEGTATDEQQRLCGWFLESLFDADENGVSRGFPETVRCETYNGEYSGYFYELGPRKDSGPFELTVQLLGATIHTGFYEDSEPTCRLWATDQISFVFMKTGQNLGDLVTIERVVDLNQERYKWLREKLVFPESGPDLPFYVFWRRGQDRLLANEYRLASLLYAIKRQFMPMLRVLDDYLHFASVSRTNHLDEQFNRSIFKPELAGKWGFDFDSIEPILTKIEVAFEKDRIENLELSHEATATLIEAEIYSLSDLRFWERGLFQRMCKPTPEVLAEIEEAMDRAGYAFEPEPTFGLADDLVDDFDEFDEIAFTDEELRIVFDETASIEYEEE